MAYGFDNKGEAFRRMERQRQQNDGNEYEVAAFEWSGNEPIRWGVLRFTPYCEQMPWKCDGFVWFEA